MTRFRPNAGRGKNFKKRVQRSDSKRVRQMEWNVEDSNIRTS